MNVGVWNNRPYQLTNWWDMKPFPVSDFINLVRGLGEQIQNPEEATRIPIGEEKSRMLTGINVIILQCEECSLPLSADQFKRIRAAAERGANFACIESLLPEAMNRIEDESKRLVVLAIEPEHVKYAENALLFDLNDPKANKVSVQFSSAAEDITESGKCLACGRATACVMHLNRVMEVGLAALAKAVGVGPQNDWGKYLKEIDRNLQDKLAKSGARTPDAFGKLVWPISAV